MKRALGAALVAGLAAGSAQAIGWGALRDLGALGRRFGDLDQGFRVPVTLEVRTPTYQGSAEFTLVVTKGERPGLRLRTIRDVATPVEGHGGAAACELDVVVDDAGLWLTARPSGAGAPKRALALSLPVTGQVAPPPRKRRGGGDLEAIDGGFQVRVAGKDGEPVVIELRHDPGHWPSSLRVAQGEARELRLEFGAFELGPERPRPPLPPAAYGALDMVGVVRLLPLLRDSSAALGEVSMAELFPMAPGQAPPPTGALAKISLARLAAGEKLGFGALLKLASVLDEAELVEGLREGVRKLRGQLARSWAPPPRRGLFRRRRR